MFLKKGINKKKERWPLNFSESILGTKHLTLFTVNIASRDLENISKCVLLSATIPRNFGNVYEPINILHGFYSLTPQTPTQPFVLTIPPGLYNSVTQLAVNSAIIVLFPFISVTFDETRKRITVSATHDKPPLFNMLIAHEDTLAHMCGFSIDIHWSANHGHRPICYVSAGCFAGLY